jgi:6-phosphofructokinase 1
MRIGVLTGGGDVPGLNPCIKALVYRAIDEGHEVVGIRRGWGGLLNLDPGDSASREESVVNLNKQNTRTIDRTGGTILHTSRVNPSNVRPAEVPLFLRSPSFDENARQALDFTPHILKVLETLGLEVLVPIGGDDTLLYGARLCEENFPIISIPKTMDNDVYGTDYCIGFSTAITRSVQFIHQLRTSSGSHERITIIELFGRYSGETCLVSSYLSATDRAIISEVPFDPEKLARLLMEDRKRNPSNYAMVAISEGARFSSGKTIESGQIDAYGHRKLGGIGLFTAEAIKEITGLDTIYQQVAYLMRTGAPDSLDLMVAVNYAQFTMDLINRRSFGHMVALQNGIYTCVPANTLTMGQKRVDVDQFYNTETYRPRVRSVEGKPMFLY